LVGLVDSPSESSESLSPSPSLAGHQNQQVGLDNQQGGGYNTSIIQGGLFNRKNYSYPFLRGFF